jgi:signal transduction histidine kinase
MEKTLTRFAALVALTITLSFPAITFVVGFQYVRATLESEAEINARLATAIVNADPEHWKFQSNRLDELLARRPTDRVPEIRRIVDVEGREVFASVEELGEPTLMRRSALRDSGRVVGYLEVHRSLRSLIGQTALFGVLGLILAFVVAFAVRTLPLRALRTTLEQLLAEQQNVQSLQLARQAAEMTAKLQSQFLANMSHEIRTPMNGVLGMTELLMETELTLRQRRFADAIRRSGDALLKIVNDILDFSKIEAGKMELEKTDFDLRELVEDVAELVAERAQSKGVELICKIPPGLPQVFVGDPGRIRQVLVNLVNNGIKFTEVGHVLVELDCVEPVVAPAGNGDGSSIVPDTEAAAPPRSRVRFRVTDTGIGIAPQIAAKLFQPFVQADVSTTRKYGGTGLGLAISQQLIAMMGGVIVLESAVGEGSTFSFELDLETLPARSAEPAVELAGQRVLVVEDNAINRSILHEHVIGCRRRRGPGDAGGGRGPRRALRRGAGRPQDAPHGRHGADPADPREHGARRARGGDADVVVVAGRDDGCPIGRRFGVCDQADPAGRAVPDDRRCRRPPQQEPARTAAGGRDASRCFAAGAGPPCGRQPGEPGAGAGDAAAHRLHRRRGG